MAMKKYICILFIFIFACTLTVGAAAEVYDGAMILNDREEEMLQARIESLGAIRDCHIIIYTEDYGNYATAEMSARTILEQSGAGNGVIFYVAMGSRDWHVYTTGDAWDMFNSLAMDEIEIYSVENLSTGDYYLAFDEFLNVCEDVFEMANAGESYTPPKRPEVLIFYLIIAAVIAFVTGLIWALVLKSKLTSVRLNHGASNYQDAGSFALSNNQDIFLYKNVTCVAKPKSNGSSGIGGGGGGSRGGKF